ncbi:hypothetical protein EV183_000169 [Coemansia sp. RSA 2336]|nr:hypothetical protein EV183_000169 [Coemansia sp. RSA 2336]
MFAPDRHRYQTILQIHSQYTQATYVLLGKAISELQVLALANNTRALANYDHATRLECFTSVAYQLSKHIDAYRRMSSRQAMRHRDRLVHIYLLICPDAHECDIQNEIDAGTASQVLAVHTSNSHELLDDVIDRQNDIVRESRTIKQLTLLYRQVWELLSRQQARLSTPYVSTEIRGQADEKHGWWRVKAKHGRRMWYAIGLLLMLIVLVTFSVLFAVLANRGK